MDSPSELNTEVHVNVVPDAPSRCGNESAHTETTAATEMEVPVKLEPLDGDLAISFSDLWASDENDPKELDRYEQTLRVCIAFYTGRPLFRYISYVVARECIMVRISNFNLHVLAPPHSSSLHLALFSSHIKTSVVYWWSHCSCVSRTPCWQRMILHYTRVFVWQLTCSSSMSGLHKITSTRFGCRNIVQMKRSSSSSVIGVYWIHCPHRKLESWGEVISSLWMTGRGNGVKTFARWAGETIFPHAILLIPNAIQALSNLAAEGRCQRCMEYNRPCWTPFTLGGIRQACVFCANNDHYCNDPVTPVGW